jgi:hypothetical protein
LAGPLSSKPLGILQDEHSAWRLLVALKGDLMNRDGSAGYTKKEAEAAFRPIASLIAKSEKAVRKLAPGTWQHAMLRDNLEALHIASSLMAQDVGPNNVPRANLEKALLALDSMIRKAEQAQAKFAPGTAHYTLQRNRIAALRLAKALTKAALDSWNA